jgi:hypothetical protein
MSKKIKVLVIILIVLIVIGWGLAVYFGLKWKASPGTCSERLEKLNAYADLLKKSTDLSRQNKSFDILETDVRSINNGVLLAEWQNVVFSGNKKEDLDNYFDVIIDALNFFSK